ncbi:hypothetical protein SADUNF_Sadunf17G0079100 [Salix dunnii]|uniref:Uncharacterized protein n=1 Tax=Salix dunnii TaxID=1413687 RepID=A0A835MNC8_9ROSI|nr:hypothetical protein SADUNF_Sadunf17G0079100 [Salix dunnii]
MANTERKKPGEEERKIQVLTVLRNGAILKNIFVTIEKASPTSSEPIRTQWPLKENLLKRKAHWKWQEKDVGSLYFDVICDSIAKKEISSAALVVDESLDSLFYDANEDIDSSFRNDHKSPGYFSFQQELPETESKGSSMIRESNVKFFSTRTPLSTASPWDIPGLRVEVNEVDAVKVGGSARLQAALACPPDDENLLATESKPAEVKMYQDENLMATEREYVERKAHSKWQEKMMKNIRCEIIDVGSLYCDEICESVARKEISSAALVLDESMDSLFYDANEHILRPTTVQEPSKITFIPYKQPEEEMIASPDKENQRPLKFLQQTKLAMPASKNQVKFKQDMVLEDCKAEGVPLQSLLVNFSGNSFSVPNDTTRNGIFVNCSQIMRKVTNLFFHVQSNLAEDGKRWTVVADTASLVGKESRKSLQLLQGLKGTHLVITKMGTVCSLCTVDFGWLFALLLLLY